MLYKCTTCKVVTPTDDLVTVRKHGYISHQVCPNCECRLFRIVDENGQPTRP